MTSNINTFRDQEYLEYTAFEQLSKDNRFDIRPHEFLKEKIPQADKHYVFHSAWAARILAKLCPEKHVDFSSLLYFNTLVSAFIPIDSYNYYDCPIELDNLKMSFADLTKLPFDDNSISSMSCMHVVEHIGLGRYFEPLEPQADLKAIEELKRVLSVDLLFVVPIGVPPRVIFNIHRIYSYDQIMSYFSDLKLIEFALIPDMGSLIKNATKEMADKQGYGCGCFWFRKE